MAVELPAAGGRPVFQRFPEHGNIFLEFPVLFVQMNFGGFLITYLSPDALAALRLASLARLPDLCKVTLVRLAVPKIRARFAPEIRLFIELITGGSPL